VPADPIGIQWRRVFLCGLIAGGVWTLLSITLLFLVGGDFLAVLPEGGPSRGGVHAFLLGSNIAAGIWAMWLYAAIRPRYGPAPKRAAVAGLAWWFIGSLQSGKWVATGFAPPVAALGPLVATLPAIIAATMVGAWAYEADGSAAIASDGARSRRASQTKGSASD
jgi:hypothetical protein